MFATYLRVTHGLTTRGVDKILKRGKPFNECIPMAIFTGTVACI